ncbi:polyphosphate kinase 2 [Actinosynnema sp. NPDC047251]|nr:polyphosphate kinase 2 [Saccharothrix espanaensis]
MMAEPDLLSAAEVFPELSGEIKVRFPEGEEPVLLRPDGTEVDTWRENYPFAERLGRTEYARAKRLLHIEMLKLQYWVQDTGRRVVIVFEGRDAAGKGGTIRRFTENLDPRGARVVALGTPTERERGQWYFQRYVEHLPTAGEMVLFDRSWYNRAGVERVMGYCDDEQYERFLRQAPEFERMLVDDGVVLVKLWFSVSRAEQRTRFIIRQVDPVRRWKLSANDLASLDRWDDYTEAKVAMFRATDTAEAPWTVVKSNDKRRARLEAMRSVLARLDYADRDLDVVGEPDGRIVGAANTLLEAGEDDTSLSPTPIAADMPHEPGLHPDEPT